MLTLYQSLNTRSPRKMGHCGGAFLSEEELWQKCGGQQLTICKNCGTFPGLYSGLLVGLECGPSGWQYSQGDQVNVVPALG